MKKVAILGSTGSIGTNTLDVIRQNPGRFQVTGLAAGNNRELLGEQIAEFSPGWASLSSRQDAEVLEKRWGDKTRVLWGEEGLRETALSAEAGTVVVAVPGIGALEPTMEAIAAGSTIALASKEVLVAAGELVTALAEENDALIIPVDSEHSAVFQCLRGENPAQVARIILTASGGPFLATPPEELNSVTPAQALAHPRWRMGRKVSLDSSTLMNKGLEVLEAHHLFRMPLDRIEVVIHPQSIVHALIETVDGALLAQLGRADMRLPIAFALNFPERRRPDFGHLDLTRAEKLTFSEPDRNKFPCLELAYRAGRAGGTLPAVLNAANEVAGEAFLAGKIGFSQIPRLIEKVMDRHKTRPVAGIEDVWESDREARESLVGLLGKEEQWT